MATPTVNTEAETTSAPPPSPLRQLSFTGQRPDGGIDPWMPSVPTRGGWYAECKAGRKAGVEAAEYIRETGDMPLLGAIARRMVQRGTFEGFEVGFFTALSILVSRSPEGADA